MTCLDFSRPDRAALLASLGLVAASVGFGLLPYFARSLTSGGMAPYAVVFFRYAATAVVFRPMLRVRRGLGGAALWGIASGVTLGLG